MSNSGKRSAVLQVYSNATAAEIKEIKEIKHENLSLSNTTESNPLDKFELTYIRQ